MKMLRFKNIFQNNQGSTTQSGFTLVEISIVMIIIGLLISGIFGGMKLVDNANVQKTVQDLKAIESAALTFRDTYRALPGDIRNPNTRIPNCTVAPCATTGNGNRVIGTANLFEAAITNTDENFLFWHHLQAANLLALNYNNSMDMEFGEGQPSSPFGAGYRISNVTGNWWTGTNFIGSILFISASANANAFTTAVNCNLLGAVDRKFDDGRQLTGAFQAWSCANEWPFTASTIEYIGASVGTGIYDLRAF